ncbi:MAG: hypothetical protein NDJ89_10915, partial [Oligoflexia bacterium]|nr:hypothetical protein [Oligoflexia bacterium]
GNVFGFGKLRYLEFRKAYDLDGLSQAQEEARSGSTHRFALFDAASEKITHSFDEFARNHDPRVEGAAVIRQMNELVRSLESLTAELGLPKAMRSRLLSTIYQNAHDFYALLIHDFGFHESVRASFVAESSDYSAKLFIAELTYITVTSDYTIAPPPYMILPGGALVKKADFKLAGSLGAYLE